MRKKTDKLFIFVPCMNNGGAEKVLYLIAKKACENKEVFFIFLNSNLSYYDLSMFKCLYLHNLSLFNKIKRIREIMIREKNAVFLSFFDKISMILSFAKGLNKKIKLVISERNDPNFSVKKKIIPIRNFLFNNGSSFVFQTVDAKKYFSKKIQKRSHIVLNPVKFVSSPEYIEKKDRNKVFVSFSRFNKQKNIPLMINAFNVFSRMYPEYSLEIYGDKGNDYEVIMELIKSINNPKIKIKEFDLNIREKINKYYCFVSSSNFEGISNSMIESLSVGLPVVCTDCPIGGAKMFVKDGENGYLSKINDVSSMVQAFVNLVKNENIFESCYENIAPLKEKIDEKIILEKWMRILFE